MGVGRSAILYLNSSYPVTHLTLLEAVPEGESSIYDRMSVTLGVPTGVGFHTEVGESFGEFRYYLKYIKCVIIV